MAPAMKLVVAAVALAATLALASAAKPSTKAPPTKAPPSSASLPRGVRPLQMRKKRVAQLSCEDDQSVRNGCVTTCPDRCPDQCFILCATCKTYCICDFFPGQACGDPRFTGADGNNFYFHGKKDADFCLVSDAGLHINAHFIGIRNNATGRDFTWVQALGIRFGAHRLYVGARKTAKWHSDADHLNITFDGSRVSLAGVPGARWSAAPLSVERVSSTNSVMISLPGVFTITANAVPVTARDSKIHSYGVTAGDAMAHLDVGFQFHGLSDDVHGVLGQTYRPDYVNKLDVSKNMPIMADDGKYTVSGGIFAADCAVARFAGGDQLPEADGLIALPASED